ncbi:antA/AntB antirepressor family protein [uncultured Psychrobacter sp.]|uniref:antA/AntB antirepressor family protein n=1 Tax=Psychrobacter TaxID=497 RepID=UPI0030DB7C58|tara:strand:+ start:6010 stop:6717 length:708 start_codon:yes stop_codon:yes gene_type:complete
MKLPTIQENQDLQQAVDAKELYQSLGLDISNWSRWSAKNIAENPFAVQGVDFLGFVMMTSGNKAQNYLLSIDFAKKLAMQVRTEMGERIRDYFLECERRTQQPVVALPDFTNPALAARAWADEYQAKQIAQEQLAEAQPKINFHDAVAASRTMMTVSDVAKKIGMTAQELNKKLVDIGAYDKRRLPKKVFGHNFITKGYGVMKLTADGYDRNLLTQSGQIYLIGLFSRARELEAV